MRVALSVALASVVAILTASAVTAQGRLSGSVYDPELGEPVVGATIRIDNHQPVFGGTAGPANRTVSDSNGDYLLLGLQPGLWTVTGTADGYKDSHSVVVVTALAAGVHDIAMSAYFTGITHWSLFTDLDAFTDQQARTAHLDGQGGDLSMAIGCADSELSVSLFIRGNRNLFHHGLVDLRFDSTPGERVMWTDKDRSLTAPVGRAAIFADRLVEHDTLLVRVTRWRQEQLTDSFDIKRSAAAIEHLQCQ